MLGHPMISMDGPNEHYRLMNLANYRAAAQNFYGFGADGVSPYNYQRGFQRRAAAHRSSSNAAYMWPAALGWLRELRYPEEISRRDRHYLFYAIYKEPRKSPSGFSNDDNIYLDRAKPVLEGSRRFRMAEDFSNPKLRTTVQFKAVGLAEDEKLEIQINGKQVPADYITRVLDKNGQNVYEGDTLPPFYLHIIDMNWETTGRKQPLVFGDNQLTVRLIPEDAGVASASLPFVDMVLGVQADDANGISHVDLNGYLDDFAVWSRLLSPAEIKGICEQGLQGVGIAASPSGDTAAAKLSEGLRVLYEFEDADDLGKNGAAGGKSAAQVGPKGAKVSRDTKAARIGTGAADFTVNDATLKVDAQDVAAFAPGGGGAATIACWFTATSQEADHTIWGLSNDPIPSPRYSTNMAKAIFNTQTVAGAAGTVANGLVVRGAMEIAKVPAKVTDGKWHHFAVTIEQDPQRPTARNRLFVDGQPAGSSKPKQGVVGIEELECYVYVRK